MSIEKRLNDQLKTAMRARDKRTTGLIRMVKSKMGELTTSKGFSGEVTDATWLQVIETYCKSQSKAIELFKKAGDDGQEHIDNIVWEIETLAEYLPAKADEATVRGWVDEAIAGLGGKEKAKLGQVMGAVMKSHKGEADAGLVRSVVTAALA